MGALPLSLRLALRELRGGLGGVWLLLACLALGVAVIAGARSLGAGLHQSLDDNARALLGGDLSVSLNYVPPNPQQQAFLDGAGTLSRAEQMRAMASTANSGLQAAAPVLVELKAVDGSYPLFGSLALDPPLAIPAALGQQNGVWGAAVDADLLVRLGLKLGDTIKVGDGGFVIRATIVNEPDRVSSPLNLGPRLMISDAALPSTGLVQPGSLIQYITLLHLNAATSPDAFRDQAAAQFPDAGWQIRDPSQAAPGLRRFLDQLVMFLSLVGLATLLVGGIGVADGVSAFLDSRNRTIATLKCLGAPRGLIEAIYAWQVAALAGIGIVIGLVIGALLPPLVLTFWGDLLPLPVGSGPFPGQLALAALFGILVATAFATWPLARAAATSGAQLFRDAISPVPVRPGPRAVALIAVAGLVLAALAIITAPEQRLAGWFVGGSVVAFGLFSGAGWLATRAARGAARWKLPLPVRLALSSLSRPGAPTPGVIMSLGLGLTVLTIVALVQSDLVGQIEQRLPKEAPSFFFIDVPSDQGAVFDKAVTDAGGSVSDRAAMVRGRITKIQGVPVEQANIAPDARWAVRGDRGLSTAPVPPPNARIAAGAWWAADYKGPPLMSLDAAVAKGFGVGVGDNISLNILGREITAKIASLRDIDYAGLSMNFAMILSPSALAGAPHGDIATVYAPAKSGVAVEKAVLAVMPSVTAIDVKAALDQIRQIMAGASGAIRAAAAVTLIAGGLVLAGAVAAGRRQRLRESVLMKVLGARRSELLAALAIEYALLGTASALLALILGSLAARGVIQGLLHLDWTFPAVPALTTVIGAVLAVAFAGLLLAGRVLAIPPAPALRRE